MPPAGDAQEHLVSEIYRAAAGAVPFGAVLRALAEATASDGAVWGTYDIRRGTATVVHSHNADAGLPPAGERGPWDTEGAVWLAAERRALRIVVAVEGDTAVRALLSRAQSGPAYGEREIALARSFAFHARRARDLERAARPSALLRAGLAEIIDDAALGVAVLDPPTVLYISPGCRAMLDALAPGNGGGLLLTDAGTAPAPLALPQPLAEAIARHDRRATASIILRHGPEHGSGGGRYVAQLRPFPLHAGAGAAAGLALVLFDPDRRVAVNAELMRSAYGLTNSEVRVCALLANGSSVDGIAAELCISPYTARTHLKRIFHKTGSARQAELVKLVLNLAKVRRTHAGPAEESERSHRPVRSLRGVPAAARH